MPMIRSAVLTLLCLGASAGEFDSIKGSLDKLRKNHPAAAEDIKSDSSVMRIVTQRVDRISSPWRVKLLSAEWLLRAHILMVRLNPDAGSDVSLLSRAWELATIARTQALAIKGQEASAGLYRGPDAARRAAAATALNASVGYEEVPAEIHELITWLHVELAARLGDPLKMKEGLEAFRLKPSKDSRTQCFAMMGAFHVGDWALAGKLGKQLEPLPKVLPALHNQSLMDPKAFDYAALLLWAERTKPAPWQGDLVIRTVSIGQCRMRPKAEATPPGDWETMDAARILPIEIRGAVAHWLTPFRDEIPQSGSMVSDRLALTGYLDGPQGRVEESLSLTLDPRQKQRWSGELIRVEADGRRSVFEVELELKDAPAEGKLPG